VAARQFGTLSDGIVGFDVAFVLEDVVIKALEEFSIDKLAFRLAGVLPVVVIDGVVVVVVVVSSCLMRYNFEYVWPL
jgi:hypothetical protein